MAEIFESVKASLEKVSESKLFDSSAQQSAGDRCGQQVFKNLPEHGNYSECDHVARHFSEEFSVAHNIAPRSGWLCPVQNGPPPNGSVNKAENDLQLMKFTAGQIAALVQNTKASVGVLFSERTMTWPR